MFFLDCNSLYGHIMTKSLPHRDFTWMSETELDEIHPLLYDESSKYGYVLEVSSK